MNHKNLNGSPPQLPTKISSNTSPPPTIKKNILLMVLVIICFTGFLLFEITFCQCVFGYDLCENTGFEKENVNVNVEFENKCGGLLYGLYYPTPEPTDTPPPETFNLNTLCIESRGNLDLKYISGVVCNVIVIITVKMQIIVANYCIFSASPSRPVIVDIIHSRVILREQLDFVHLVGVNDNESNDINNIDNELSFGSDGPVQVPKEGKSERGVCLFSNIWLTCCRVVARQEKGKPEGLCAIEVVVAVVIARIIGVCVHLLRYMFASLLHAYLQHLLMLFMVIPVDLFKHLQVQF